MPLDSIFVSALTDELNARASGAQVDKIHQPSADTVLLALRSRDGGGRLLICGGTGAARVHFTGNRFENPDAPPMFCMLLRKHLTGAKVVGVAQLGLERAVDISFDAADALGDRCSRHIIVELISAAANVVLTDGEGMIIDCMRRVSGDMSGKRRLLPGLRYRAPEAQDKKDPFETAHEEKLRLLSASGADMRLDKRLLDCFLGLSPLICREAVYRAYGETDARVSETPDGGGRAVSELEAILETVRERRFTPVLLSEPDGKPRDFSFARITQYEDALRLAEASDFSSLLDGFYTKRDNAEKLRARSQGVSRACKNARERLTRKLASQRTELLATRDREALRQCGDLLMASLNSIPRGAVSFEAEDFYGAEGDKRVIKLDASKSPQQNAAKYYKDFNRAKNAERYLTEQIASGERELDYLESVAGELERASSERDLAELRRELEDAGYLKKQTAGKKMKRPASKPMRFVSDAGVEIRVGRTGTQNDELTKSAARTDVWLHTQKIHGSHVVISCAGAAPDEGTLAQAARLAAYYSQARSSSSVPVDYTLVKHVKKPGGARPGMVIYTDCKTLFVTPDEAEAGRLRRD